MFDWHHMLSADYIMHLYTHYGYSVIFSIVMLESLGLPLPAESLLATSALLCATTYQLNIANIALCGITAAIIGDNIIFFCGAYVGMDLIEKYGPRIGITQKRQNTMNQIFNRYGGAIVFFGRFISFLRMPISLLAGAGKMSHRLFLFYNVLSDFLWGTIYTLIPYYLGKELRHLTYPIAMSCVVAFLLMIAGGLLLWRKKKHKWTQNWLSNTPQKHSTALPKNVITVDLQYDDYAPKNKKKRK